MIQILKKNITSIFICFYLLIAFVNDGFMGTDEYWNAMVKYLPAQTAKVTTLVEHDDVKSPLQVLPMYLGSQLALKMNIYHAYDQYRFTIIFIACINILLYLIAFHLLTKYKNWKDENESVVFIGLMTFYFASSFALTRPMFESLAAPWILLSCGFFLKYWETKKNSALILSTLAVSMAFIMRQQAGIGALTIPLLLLSFKDYKGLVITSTVGILAFVMAGIPDIFLRGNFHHSLIAVTTYNIEHGHEYGNGSILFYPLMISIMIFLPLYFTKKFERNFVIQSFKKQKFSIIFILLFVALHSYFPQKFERFLISIIPLILVVMTPFINFLFTHYREFKFRLSIVLGINFLILIAASFQPSQNNIIKMALFIDKHPEIKKVLNFENTLEWIPEKFIIKNTQYQFIDINEISIKDFTPSTCENIIVINEFLYEKNKAQLHAYKIKDKFGVNFIESISYKLNRKNNIRRSPLVILGC